MKGIDGYIGELESCLRVGRWRRARILAEIRDHLVDATDGIERAGAAHDLAVAQAVEAFGRPSVIASQFNAEAGTRAMRRAPIIVLSAGIAVFGGLVVAGTSMPRSAAQAHALFATQVSFFVAVVAFEIALVAGICAASRALTRWRSPVAPGDDRDYVRRTAIVSTSALGIAATGWVVTLTVAVDRVAALHPAAIFGGAVMIGAAIVAVVMMRRLPVNRTDDVPGGGAETTWQLDLGERMLGFVSRHPVVACATVAAFSVWPAMAHAETSFTGALPWGVAQPVAVVGAFLLLGPALGLRRRAPVPTV